MIASPLAGAPIGDYPGKRLRRTAIPSADRAAATDGRMTGGGPSGPQFGPYNWRIPFDFKRSGESEKNSAKSTERAIRRITEVNAPFTHRRGSINPTRTAK